MPPRANLRRNPRGDLDCLAKRQRAELAKRCARIGYRVERQGLFVARGVMFVGVIRLLLLQFRAVDQQNLAKLDGRRRRVNRTAKALSVQQRQRATVIHVRMREDNGGDLRRVERKCNPVERAQILVALEQAAIDQNPRAITLNKCF